MNKTFLVICALVFSILITNLASASESNKNYNSLTIEQVMQQVLDRYRLLKISHMEVSQAAHQQLLVESGLSWILDSSVGVSHDLTGLGTPSDKLDINGSIARTLKSGAKLSLSGGYRYEDSSLSFSPSLPNPSHTTRVDISYRMPLSQGIGNPSYKEGVVSAETGVELAKANLLLTRNTVADKVKELFYSSALVRSRINNILQSIKRTKKLALYINKNVRLGLSENKDKLQVIAQLHSKQAELGVIKLQWKQLQNSLKRLMLDTNGYEIHPKLNVYNDFLINADEMISHTKAYHPTLKISLAKLELANSRINTALDGKKDNLDVVMSVGSRTSDGESKTGSVSEQDWAGTVSLQYKHLFDNKGVSAKYRQAIIDKDIAVQDIEKVNDDILYTIYGLVNEISTAKHAAKLSLKQLNSESLKLKEAEQRFRSGRANTAQLIQFQNEYSFAQLNYEKQNIELKNRIVSLKIYSGQFWEAFSKSGVVK